MEPKKRWDGYVSFSYLEPGVDYKEFELSPQIGRVEPFVYPLTDEQNERADRLLRDCVCISLHDHCGVTPVDMSENDEYVREGRERYGYEGLAASCLDAVFANLPRCDGNDLLVRVAVPHQPPDQVRELRWILDPLDVVDRLVRADLPGVEVARVLDVHPT